MKSPQTTVEPISAEPPWVPMHQTEINPDAQRISAMIGDEMDEVWVSDIYECQVRYLDDGAGRSGPIHLSIKRKDRSAYRDWRHLQAIKNEVCGWEREALELFPAESRLTDTANQTHLWVLPPGVEVPLGFTERIVATQEDAMGELRRRGLGDEVIAQAAKARQRPWQPGISTGPRYKP